MNISEKSAKLQNRYRDTGDAFHGRPRSVRLVRHDTIGNDVSDAEFLSYAGRLASRPYSVVLLSGGNLDCSRYSIAGWDPLVTFSSRGTSVEIRSCDGSRFIEGNPLDVLDTAAASLRPRFPLVVPPFAGGAMGYFAYDLKNSIERLPRTALDDLQLPDIFLVWPSRILVHDRLRNRLDALILAFDDPIDEKGTMHAGGPLPDGADGTAAQDEAPMRVGRLESNFTHEAYLEAVRKIKEYIRAGDVYQVNLSQRFQFPFDGSPFRLWESLFAVNPAPFYAFIHGGDHQVLSTSMERFLFRSGSRIETRPIKGTRRRGASPEEDRALSDELVRSPKDDAELSMIVDLLRNDLGRVCRARTIRVEEHKRLEAYQNVYHLVSIVAGELNPGVTPGVLLEATFPGGSITGCPKIRAMEIIDELEPHVRHIYTGAIGYLGWHENLDLNVAIRTALVHRGKCYYSVGGGVVFDSREEDEFQETLHKGRTLFQLIGKLQGA